MLVGEGGIELQDLQTVTFTGHRPAKFGQAQVELVKLRLADMISRLITERNAKHFIAGGAVGVDQWAAEAVLCARQEHDITLELALPFRGYDARWPAFSRKEYSHIRTLADKVTMVSEGRYHPSLYQHRNEYMVDHADCVIAVYDGSTGGTRNCVMYAMEQDKVVYRIEPPYGENDIEAYIPPRLNTA